MELRFPWEADTRPRRHWRWSRRQSPRRPRPYSAGGGRDAVATPLAAMEEDVFNLAAAQPAPPRSMAAEFWRASSAPGSRRARRGRRRWSAAAAACPFERR
jgi:hypothetical protein